MTSALTASLFGRHSVGSVFGTMFLAHQTGAALGSWLGGALFEATGGYGAAFAVGSTILALAAVVSLTIDERVPRLRPAPATE
jgi:predicted MFS family arabinose efflux permease